MPGVSVVSESSFLLMFILAIVFDIFVKFLTINFNALEVNCLIQLLVIPEYLSEGYISQSLR